MRCSSLALPKSSAKGLKSLFLAGILAALAPPLAQAQGKGGYQGPVGGHPLITAPTAFKWSSTLGVGSVKVPLPGQYGWFVVQNENLEARVVPSLTGDPTIEAIFFPPASGHPTRAERITFQFPLDPSAIPDSGALVIAFHSYSHTEKEIFLNTQIAQLCAQRGWMMVAPYGLVDTHYGNVESQTSLDAVLETVGKYFKYDPKRVYTVGFSMGGGAATSYAMRKQDKDGLRVAGVINHTGTMDLVDVYNTGNLATKLMLADVDHFHGAPTTEDGAFPYERVSPAVFNTSMLELDKMPIRNLGHLAMYTYVNLNDPLNHLVLDNLAVGNELLAQGVNLQLVSNSQAAIHDWSTMDMNAAFNWVDRSPLALDPNDAWFNADQESNYLFTEVRKKTDLRSALYRVEVDTFRNLMTVKKTKHIDELVMKVRDMGLTVKARLFVQWSTVDSATDSLIFTDYRVPPRAVTAGGSAYANWTHDPIEGELTIVTPAGQSLTTFIVTP